jgi:hypothetical protein
MTKRHARPALPDVDAATVREPWLWIRLGDNGTVVTGSPNVRLGQVNLPAPLQTGRDVHAEWQWDGREVVVRTCRLGFFPLYYYATDKVFGVSPAIEQLLAHGAPADLDDAAMSVYLRLGWNMGEDTVFRHIRALPPGGTVTWSGGAVRVTGGIRHPKPLHISRDEAIATFADLVRQAVRRRASPEVPYVLPLSGGRDRRSIFLELMTLGCKPRVCYTNHDFPPYRTQNIEIARQLARRFDLPHQSLGQPTSRLAAELAKNRLNNFGAAENVWCVSLYGEIARRHPGAIVYEGSPGGTTYSQYCKPEHLRLLEQGRKAEVARAILDKWLTWHASEDALQRVLSPEAAARFSVELAMERMQQELTRHIDAPNPLVSFLLLDPRTARLSHAALVHRPTLGRHGRDPLSGPGPLGLPASHAFSHQRRQGLPRRCHKPRLPGLSRPALCRRHTHATCGEQRPLPPFLPGDTGLPGHPWHGRAGPSGPDDAADADPGRVWREPAHAHALDRPVHRRLPHPDRVPAGPTTHTPLTP